MTGGLSVRTTLDPKLQIYARQALARGLITFDRKRGFRGPVKNISLAGDWGETIGKMRVPSDLDPWRLAVVLEVDEHGGQGSACSPKSCHPALSPATARPAPSRVALMAWARKYVDGTQARSRDQEGHPMCWRSAMSSMWRPTARRAGFIWPRSPMSKGALVAMDPHTGRVLALVGGFSYGKSQFNRAVQALRQPGSSFKPFVYAAALDNGYTPSSVVLDAPIEFKMSNGEIWKPKNYQRKYYGPSTLRRGIEQSRNVMTVRLANDLGMSKIGELAQRVGIYDKRSRTSCAYGSGSRRDHAAQDDHRLQHHRQWRQEDRADAYRPGAGPLRQDDLPARQARMQPVLQCRNWHEQAGTGVVRRPARGDEPLYRLSDHLDDGRRRRARHRQEAASWSASRSPARPGTSNDERDAWFIGFTPDLTVGVYIGYDNPKPMGKGRTGGELAAPVVADFMRMALRDKPATPFRVPQGHRAHSDQCEERPARSVRRAGRHSRGLQARRGTAVQDQDHRRSDGDLRARRCRREPPAQPESEAVIEGGLTTGTGGLY